MKNLVLLGAGASHGSEPTGQPTPPLGNKLFGELLARPGVASGLPQSVKESFKDFEEGMAKFAESRSGDIQQFQREMAGYLAEFLPSENSLYRKLLTTFDRKETVFASLNYDLLLEEAMEASGYHPSYALELLYKHIRLLKPHGSSNFWYDAPGSTFKNIRIEGCGTALVAPVRPRTRVESLALCRQDDSFAPAMSLYAKGKEVKTCPDFVIEQQRLFAEACSRAENIYIIGVRVVPEDYHVWGPLKQSPAHVNYFGGKQDESDFLGWAKAYKSGKYSFIQEYFAGALECISQK
ncbi:hypothetical protein [Pseudomonas putida]|uniref:hypothetical protein n=1 Tax=Pseudomonas putida TaxID=303 RepID=UPI0034669C0E